LRDFDVAAMFEKPFSEDLDGHGDGGVAEAVFAERFSEQGRYNKVTQANLTYVAVDDKGRPRPIAP